MKNRDYVIGLLGVLVNFFGLGMVGVIDKLGTSQAATPLIYSLYSIFFSLIFIFCFNLLYLRGAFIKQLSTVSFPSLKLIMAIGVCSSGIFILLRFIGLRESIGTFATMSQVFTSSLTAILASFLIGEKLSKKFWFLFFIIIIATYFVSIGRIALAPVKAGDLYIILGTVFLAAGNIFSKKAVHMVNPSVVGFGRFFFGFFFLLVVNILFLDTPAILSSFNYLAIISGFLWAANVLGYNIAIKKIGVTLATSVIMTASVLTMLLESTFLQREFTAVQVVSALVVVSCGVLMVFANRK